MPITTSRRRAVVTAGLLVCATVPAVAQGTPRAKAKTPPPNSMIAFLPLAPGAKWKWSLKVDDRQPVAMEWHCVRQVHVGKGPGPTSGLDVAIDQSAEDLCWEVRTLRGTYRSWQYWAARKDGIYRFSNRYLGGMRGVTPRQPTKIIPGPLGISTKWKWTETGSLSTEGSSDYPKKRELAKHYEGSIEAMSEKVTVPAGTFDAIRLEFKMKSKMFGNTNETMWLSRGTGIIKRVVRYSTGASRHVYELQSYSPRTEVTGSIRGQIEKLLTTDKACINLGKPDSLAPISDDTLETHLGSRFFAARGKNGVVFFRQFEGKASIFHPGKKASWNRLLTEEIGELQRTDAMDAVKAFGVLWSLYDSPGSRPVPRGSELNTRRGGNFDVRAWIVRTGKDGKRRRGFARMWFEEGKITRMESDVGPRAPTQK
jgi:hypothetical protein